MSLKKVIYFLVLPVLAISGLWLLLLMNDGDLYERYVKGNLRYFSNQTFFKGTDESLQSNRTFLLDYCNLTELDPWDPSILSFIKPQEPLSKTCTPQIELMSQMIDGQLFVSPPEYSECFWRCLHPKDDYNINYGDWVPAVNGSKPQCDIVEVECRSKVSNTIFSMFSDLLINYKFLHAQIYRPNPPPVLESSPSKYDVHIILFDSTSHSSFIRSMPQTRQLLKDSFEAISFPHLNKIGLKSLQNGYGFLMGKTVDPIKETPFSRERKADYPSNFCEKYIDDDQFIGYRFQDDGYVTMMSEDWALGVFNWPSCKGFEKPPVDHYMRPFAIRAESGYANNLYQDSCRKTLYYEIEYLKDFLKKYPDKPKFSLIWDTNVAHEDINGLSSVDEYFYSFLKNSQKDLDNAFIFIMGDHGFRRGEFRHTEIGEIEDNNPLLWLSVPKELRSNAELMENLRANSKKLVTHYDLYATFVSITNPAKPRYPDPLLKGSSLFLPLPEPRSCDSLEIPFDYCACRRSKSRLSKFNPIAIPAAKRMVAEMNRDLRKFDDTDECSNLTLDRKAEILVDQFKDGYNGTTLYQVTFSTQPGGGQFWGTVSKDSNGKLDIISHTFPRLNAYGSQADCAETAFFASYCYCKNLL